MTLATVGAIQAFLYLLFIRAIDLYDREPLRYVIPVFVWGFTVAAVTALIFNFILAATLATIVEVRVADFVTVVVGAPLIEESAKALALLVAFGIAYLVARGQGTLEFAGVMDGIIYGSAVGFGFSLAEDLLYLAQFGPEVFITRRLFGGFGHAAFSALVGVGIGLAPWVRPGFLKLALPVLGLSAAILLHALFNLTAVLFGALAYVLLFVVILLYVVLIAVWLAFERRIIREELHEEVDRGTISASEYAILPTYFRRNSFLLSKVDPCGPPGTLEPGPEGTQGGRWPGVYQKVGAFFLGLAGGNKRSDAPSQDSPLPVSPGGDPMSRGVAGGRSTAGPGSRPFRARV